jgi:2,5-diamino-6-(ribosylamino)-4(3H)-pyrimidinone 5'-phosphate reductase
MSADGKIALPNKKQIRISSEQDIQRMYHLRDECDAVLVGIGTVLSDDPKLTVKEKYVRKPNQPVRIVLDSHCKTPIDSLVVNDVAKTLVVTSEKCKKIYGKNVEVIQCDSDGKGLIDLDVLLDLLFNRGIKRLLVEGGSTVIWNFIKKRLFDDLYVYVGPIIIGGRETPTLADGNGIMDGSSINLEIVNNSRLGEGILIHYRMLK